jgi:hypothetical protein
MQTTDVRTTVSRNTSYQYMMDHIYDYLLLRLSENESKSEVSRLDNHNPNQRLILP